MSPKRKAPVAFPARRHPVCGGLVLIGMEKFHLCPGPRGQIVIESARA